MVGSRTLPKIGIARTPPVLHLHPTGWGLEPAVTHRTSWLETIDVCGVRQYQAGGSSVRNVLLLVVWVKVLTSHDVVIRAVKKGDVAHLQPLCVEQ